MWVVGITKAHQEQRVRDRLREYASMRGIDVDAYVPILRETMHSAGTTRRREGPMFPRYVFISIVDCWRFLLNTRGMLGLVLCGDQPACVADKIVKAIMAKENAEGVIELPSKPEFIRGQRVRLKRGCFEDLVGIYEGSDSLERERVLLNILGRETRVNVGSGSIVAA